MEYFGVKLIKRKYSFNLRREEFALINAKPSLPMFDSLIKRNAYIDETGTKYRKEWCEEYRKLCLQNFDLNMKYFSLLDREEFNIAICEFLKKYNGFNKISNLFGYSEVSGYYLMILDEYKQVYIGKTDDIKRRIQQHWSCSRPFDRTLFPLYGATTSCFSIDFFRALDTTRIYVWKKSLSDGIEKKLIKDFPEIYITNRIGGDISNGIEALSTIHKRTFR